VDAEVVLGWTDAGIDFVARCGGWSAGRVTVPERLKFCSSLGPIASVAGVVVVLSGVLCAASDAGASASPAAQTAIAKRLPALIHSRPCDQWNAPISGCAPGTWPAAPCYSSTASMNRAGLWD
jgi:hypothetical protein